MNKPPLLPLKPSSLFCIYILYIFIVCVCYCVFNVTICVCYSVEGFVQSYEMVTQIEGQLFSLIILSVNIIYSLSVSGLNSPSHHPLYI